MKKETTFSLNEDYLGATYRNKYLVLVSVVLFLLALPEVHAAGPGGKGSGGTSNAVRFESIPSMSPISRLSYTIQAGNFDNITNAQKAFDSIVNKLDENQLHYLRIEKIGEYYCVRLGKFDGYDTARDFFQTIKHQLSDAIILEAYIKDERILKLFQDSSLIDQHRITDQSFSTRKRVILTAKAAERLGIETGKVGKESIIRKQIVGGRIIPPMKIQPMMTVKNIGFGGFGQLPNMQSPQLVPKQDPADNEVWVLVTLSQGEWDRLAKDKPVRLLPLATRDEFAYDMLALPSGIPPIEDIKRSMLKLFYKVSSTDHGLTLNTRVRVEMQLSGSEEKQKVIPYGAVYYDAKGISWVYVNPEPLIFERQPIIIEDIIGDQAVLFDGPPVGTTVVSVGASLLYGAEVVFGK
ncbi:MAG: SPOR domain-containing protein [Nitrospiraceae bacterium]|nr:MAG: SPOR domain-containing protein [Nitrospiraceae bacterium]